MEKDIDKNIWELYHNTHFIEKRIGIIVDLGTLKWNESVCYGDGKTYHYLLTIKK